MNIKRKIALLFTVLTAVLLVGIFIFIYFFSYRYTANEFEVRLRERAYISAQALLEKDELNATIYNDIRKKHLQLLPGEREVFYRVNLQDSSFIDTTDGVLPASFYENIFEFNEAQEKIEGTNYYGILYPDNEGNFIVVLSAQDKFGSSKLFNLRNTLLLLFGLSLGIIYITGHYYARQVLSPISRLISRANDIRATNLHLRLETGDGKDEIAELADTFNKMLDRLETAFDLQRNFINNASHELKTPLTSILGEAEVTLRKERSPEQYRQTIETIREEAGRLGGLVNSLLQLAQLGSNEKGVIIQELDLLKLLQLAKRQFDIRYPNNQLVIVDNIMAEYSSAYTVTGSADLLQVAFINLFENAYKFSNNKPVRVLVQKGSAHLKVMVEDQGVGIPKAELEKVKEPFYRAGNVKPYSGHGIGLSLSQRIVKMHDGRLGIHSESDGGTTVTVELPLHAQF